MPDLNAIPGMTALRSHTKGDPRIKIAVLDGPVDLDRACFQGANITRINPYWSEEFPIDPQHLQAFLDVEKSGKSDEEKEEMFKEAIPDENIRHSLHLRFHANHIISTICGQPDSPVEGIAPNATVINIPIAYGNDDFINPLNLSRAISTAIEQGVNIIHCAACHPTQSGLAHEFIDKAIRQAQDNNILVIAPGGNDKGECWCIPAVLENVLTVGAMKDTGEPFKFSNFGGKYATQGILAPGENILGSQPGTDDPIRKKGTSCAAPIVTGTAALLMSLQLEQGLSPDAEAVRAALTNSAIPCDPKEVEEPERCLLGKINIAGAYELLTGQKLLENQSSETTFVLTGSPSVPQKTLSTTYTANFPSLLFEKRISLAITSYLGKLITLSPENNQLKIQCKTFERPMGLAVSENQIAIGDGYQIWQLQKSTSLNGNDYYLPKTIHVTGGIDIHEIEWIGNELWFINTKFSCLSTLDDNYSFACRWKPPFIKKLDAQDRCHLNGLAVKDNRPKYVTMLAQSHTPNGWREQMEDGGVLMDIETNEVVVQGLSMPHSPRWYQDKLWLLESAKNRIGYVDFKHNQLIPLANLSGYARGLVFCENLAFVGLSQARHGESNSQPNSKNLCGIAVIDLQTGETIASLCFESGVDEIFGVSVLEGSGFPIIPEWNEEMLANTFILPQTFASPLVVSASTKVAPSVITNTSQSHSEIAISANNISGAVTPSQRSNLVYVLGTLGYDFGTEARRDTFKQLMPTITIDNIELPSNPYDARQMVDYLESNLSETKSLIWTVNLELTPIYAIKPVGAFAAEIYQVMQYMLAGQILPEADEDYVERVSIPGILTDETVKLFSGQIVPVIKVNSPRGMYGWKVNTLIESAIETVSAEHEIADEARMRRSLTSFLNRIYYDLRNLGQIARDRALNFAATNAFQAVQTFSQAVALGMELHSIEVEKSPFCRYGSECWDVKLKFFDPENGLRAKRVFRFTIDVSDRTPVTLGKVRSWAVSK
ncbi:MAG: TIGR03032 family protein [Chroococcales cyanobacterium metabat2.561]|nr:MAG: TIGR03032 family protein [Chroococcales cyanobacterium metabat2.561]